MQHILVTGGCGFIGSNFVRYLLEHRPNYRITNLDCLSYSGNPDNLADVEHEPQYQFVHGNILDSDLVQGLLEECDAVVNIAAESHVDRSIVNSQPFIETNVLGTQSLLDAARLTWKCSTGFYGRFLQVSTDEVYGSLSLDREDLKFTERSALHTNSPYSASKAAADLLVSSYHRTYGLDTLITRCSNNSGPFQFPEKVIPLFVTNLIRNRRVPLYGDGKNVRDWLDVVDHCEALLTVLERGVSGEIYNIGGNNERSNLELTQSILRIMGKEDSWIEFVSDRLGHDRRYAIDASKIETELGWRPTRSAWPRALERTVDWYVQNVEWWQRVISGAYRENGKLQYSSV